MSYYAFYFHVQDKILLWKCQSEEFSSAKWIFKFDLYFNTLVKILSRIYGGWF